ncbi:hypothetical protein SAMN02745823_01601 [Sporobacter termitidis DSM 10068]|uniref:Uncharacterized protein n=1 Tax=Sporobacter termitidis DSM 10068 TaxID=1123282 RepID=A0A1M5X4I6_9FIRM|nr:hypothetical protein [Sporobacter termitidis]SHH94770.1 hypothetical protein SAMN02745823_01601 [Sporobacter termitidis DSM 10068]
MKMSKKYEKLVFGFPAEYNQLVAMGDDPGFILSPQAYFRGASQIPGSKYNVGFQIFVKPFFIDRIPHRHSVDEYLVFMGGTFPNLFDFDAEIEFTIGKIGTDAEVFHITQPTVIRIPAGVYHCPLNFKRVDKPIFFQAGLMQDMFSSTYDTEDGGQKELWYNGPLPCKLNPEKKCDSCRSCIERDWK